ncbi:hypothetical protein [Streptomyces sp. NBC_01262]|uniref:hypothetical protein n=1 Tax=Streptomyces sp. NBC_01262 TaxID=2903803 RepID=UPI002E2F2AB5|nr:hypothetical protein [Streptomyces sp. NBC_01262]
MADLAMPAGTPATPVETVNARDIRVGDRLAIRTFGAAGGSYQFLPVLAVDEDRQGDDDLVAYRFTTEHGPGLLHTGDVRRDPYPAAVRDLLAAVIEALDVPLADRAEDDATRTALLSRRASDARIILAAVIKGDRIANCTRQLRGWTAEQLVTYTVFEPAAQADPEDGPA